MARTRNPEAKRNAIIAAAANGFTTTGFEDSSTAQIAAAAGVSEGIVFHHFGSKHGLLEACAQTEAARFIERELPRHSQGLDYDLLTASIFEWVASDRMVRQLWSEGDDRIVGALRRGWQRAVVAAMSRALVHEQRAGRCRAGDTELYARMQFAVVGEGLIAHFDSPGDWPRELSVKETAHAVKAIVSPGRANG